MAIIPATKASANLVNLNETGPLQGSLKLLKNPLGWSKTDFRAILMGQEWLDSWPALASNAPSQKVRPLP